MIYRLIDSIDAQEIEKALAWMGEYWDRPIHPDYYDARTIDEAVSLLDRYGKDAKIIAGGVDLLGLMKNRVIMPKILINIKGIPHLNHVVENDRGIAIGALTLVNDIERSALISDKYPLLFSAAHAIASPQVRNMATIGGNLCQEVRCWYYRRSPITGISFSCRRKKENGICYAVNGENQYHAIMSGTECVAICPSDMAVALSALGAEINTVSTSGGRVIPIENFYTTFGNTLEFSEVIKSIQIPAIKPGVKQHFLKFRLRKAIDFAIVSVAAVITLDNNTISHARIVLGGVSPEPCRAVKAEAALIGETITERAAESAAKAAVIDAVPLSKNSYKVPLIEVLVKRSLLG
ncbi:FAD binding domain-containing protein [Chloroflexota bacterium]